MPFLRGDSDSSILQKNTLKDEMEIAELSILMHIKKVD